MIATDTRAYQEEFTRFETKPGQQAPAWLREMQLRAFERFADLGFPTTRQEEWRFTNIAPLTNYTFERGASDAVFSSSVQQSIEEAVLDDGFYRLVFVNGYFADRWSARRDSPRGVVLENLAESVSTDSALLRRHLARHAAYQQAPFAALNTAFIEDGAYIHVPDGVTVEKPIHLIFVSAAERQSLVSHPRNVVVLGQGSRATIIESYVGMDGDPYFTNTVTEAVVGESAQLDHCKIQQERGNAYHVATTQVQQQQGSRFRSLYFSVGGSLVRNEVNSVLDGEQIECNLNGLYLANGRQHMDSRTRIDHAKPNSKSFELYKGILDERAKAVFNGKIYVHRDAQKTDAKQHNQALLLSDDAVIDTKPQLEIYADDVKCTHGATVGQLDDQALYYVRSRGVPTELARSMLIFAFTNEVVQGIQVDAIRKHLETILLADRGLPQL